MSFSIRYSPIWFAVAALMVIGCSLYVTRLPEFFTAPHYLSLGVTFDLTLGIPLLFYWLVVRKYKLSPVTVIPVFLLALLLASLILPATHHYYLNFAQQGVILVEASLFIFGLLKLRAIIKTFRETELGIPDFVERLYISLRHMSGFNRLKRIIASEVAMIYYGLFFWRIKKEVHPGQVHFSYHRQSGYVAIWSVWLFVLVIETFVFHLLLARWSEVVAWVATALSIYGALFFIADMAAIFKCPIVIAHNQLYIRIGLRWRVTVPITYIERIEPIKASDNPEKDVLSATLIGQPDVLIHLSSPIEAIGIYGIKKRVSRIALQIDDVQRLQEVIQNGI